MSALTWISRSPSTIGEMRRLFAAVLRIGLPGILRALESARLRARLRGGQRVRAEHHQRFRALGMQQQQRGEDPRIAVPERVPRIARRQTAGAHRPARVGGGSREQIVEIRMHGGLRPRIAIDRDVGSPQVAPGGAMLVEKSVEAGRAGLRRQLKIRLRIAAPILARGGDELGEGIGFTLLYLDASDSARGGTDSCTARYRPRCTPSGRRSAAASAIASPCSARPSSHRVSSWVSPSALESTWVSP